MMRDEIPKSKCRHCQLHFYIKDGDVGSIRRECAVGMWCKGTRCTPKGCSYYEEGGAK